MEENSISQEKPTAEENRMMKHIHVAAILQIVFGSLIVIGATCHCLCLWLCRPVC